MTQSNLASLVCWSLGGRRNSCFASDFQLIVGDNEPTEISIAFCQNCSDNKKKGRNSGNTFSTFGLKTIE